MRQRERCFVLAEAAKAFDLSLPKFLANSATERPRDFENCCYESDLSTCTVLPNSSLKSTAYASGNPFAGISL